MTLEKDSKFRLPRRHALAALAVPVLLAALPAVSQAAGLAPAQSSSGSGSTATGYVYVNLNPTSASTAGVNNMVAGYRRNANGSLTALPGSPFNVGGTGGNLTSQGAIQVALGGRLVLAADAGSNQISVLQIHSNGGLSPVSGSPFPSGGLNPNSIAVYNRLVYVSNVGSAATAGQSNYTGFNLGSSGALTPIADSTITLLDGTAPADLLFNSTGRNLIATRVGSSQIDSFVVNAGGLLSVAPLSPYNAPVAGPFGSAFRPTNPSEVYISLAHGGAGAGAVAAYSVASNGALKPIGASPYPDNQTAPCWLTISPDGNYVFTANAGSDSISAYWINSDGSLKLVGSTPLKGGSGSGSLGTFDLELDPTGSTLYVVEGNAKALGVLSVSGGTLTELASSPVALPTVTGATMSPFGVAVS